METVFILLSCSLVIYVVMIMCALIPICIVAKKVKSDSNLSQATERIISLCNCMAGGVFISMCFLGLVPYAIDKTTQVLDELHIKTDFPVAEFIIVIGFFLIMTIEQSLMYCQSKKKERKISQETWSSPPKAGINTEKKKENYFNSEEDESCTKLLGDNLLEILSPDSPAVTYESPKRTYQNVPMVLLKSHTREETEAITNHPVIEKHHCGNQVEQLITKPGNMVRFIILYMAISIHSLFEGMALGLQTDKMRIFHLFFAILFHESLVAFSVGITMTRQQLTLSQGVKYVLLFTLSVPVGIFMGLIIQQAPGTGGSVASAILQSLAAGIFIHVTFLELVPAEFANDRDRLAKVAFHFLGFLSLAVVTITMGSHH